MKTDGPAEERDLTESSRRWLHIRRVFGAGTTRIQPRRARASSDDSMPFGPGRDPDALGSVLEVVAGVQGWKAPMARSSLVAAWREIAGGDTAQHAVPIGIDDGVLTVQCDSTAWATQLRLMRVQIATRIAAEYPEAGVESIRFLAPNAPSWKKGPRSVQGRGPRDTYG